MNSIAFRQQLHRLAELSGEEMNTTNFIENDLKNLSYLCVDKLANTGLIASTADQGGFMLRCDIDALPIDENHLSLPFKSEKNGVSHKCGHDGHSAILREVALRINPMQLSRAVHFLFQPSEENAKGARDVLQDPVFKSKNPEIIFGMHNIPGADLGTVLIKENFITTSVSTIKFVFTGKTAHASSPQLGISPFPAIAGMLTNPTLPDFVSAEGQMCTPVYINSGDSEFGNGTSPGRAEIKLTIRADTEDGFNSIADYYREKAAALTEKYNLKLEIVEEDRFKACLNDKQAVRIVEDAAKRAGLNIEYLHKPFPFVEDFGFYSAHYPACFFGLGSGINQAPLHHSDYNFPDELIDHAAKLWMEIINYQNTEL
ncbi:MAG: amidohydrolase [Bacteroidetes bacterium]|nr:amidohydrolase [Bacteroidota bacterium]